MAGVIFRLFTFATCSTVIRAISSRPGTAFTISIVLGLAWSVSFRHSLDQTNPKVVWAILSWIVFVLALGSRAGGGLKERRSALTTVVGFTFIIVSYLALRLVSTDGGFFL